MSGNFDYPPASSRAPRGSASERPQGHPNVAARLQHLRDLLVSERARERSGETTARALETLNQELEELRSDRVRDRSNYEQARAAVDRQLQQLQSDFSTRRADRIRRRIPDRERQRNSLMEQEPDPSTSRQRRRGLRPSESLARLRDGRTNRTGNMDLDGLTGLQRGLQQAAARIGDADAAIASALDEAIPRLDSPAIPEFEWDSPLVPDHPMDSQVNGWRAKRRKLDSDDNREGLRGFSYGHYGQVVPGALKMEIASCDGGTYCGDNGESSWPENVLLNDSSVYCTKSDRCNLILRHRGETPFCLKKIVIKAPKSGFDAPIQEGMIFVSMTSDGLLERTEQYQIQYSPHRRRCRRNRGPGSRPSLEYMNSYRYPLQALERTVLTDSDHYSDSEMESSATTRAGQYYPGSTSDNPVPEFRVTTDYDDKSEDGGDENREDDDDLPSATEIERMDMEQFEDDLLCPEDEESESDDDNELSAFNRGRLEMRRQMRALRGQDDILRRRRMAPSLIEPVGPPARGSSSQAGGASHTPEVMKPHARFFIERDKSMVSIKFDPPPSGKFILIKLFSPYKGGNIDIQSIIVYGFAGPRYFPAGQFR